MKSSTVLLLALGGIGSFVAGFCLARRPDSGTNHTPVLPPAQHDLATSTGAAQPVRLEILVPSHPRDWRRLLTTIDPEEVPGVIDAALAIRDTDLRVRVLPRLLEIWATESPDEAFSWLTRQKRLPWFDAYRFFRVWAERDPTAAVANLAAIPDSLTRWSAAKGLTAEWAATDPVAARDWMNQLPDSEIRSGAIDGLCRRLAETDPAQAIQFALSLGDPAKLSGRLNGIIRIQAASDPQGALATLNRLPPDIARGPLCQGIIESLLADEPLLAGEFALTIPPSEAQSRALQNVATRLSRDSLQTALDWINSSIPAGPIRSSVFRNTLIIAAQADPRAVAPLVANLRGNLRTNVAMNLVLNWARSDPQAASAWVSQLPEDRDRGSIQRSLAGAWARNDPAAALTFALQQSSPQEQAEMLQTVGREWASYASTEARAALNQLPSNDAQKSFVDGMISGLGRNHPQAAAELVAGLPVGEVHDAAARAYISNAAWHDLQLASRVAESIGSATVRDEALTSIAQVWMSKDRAATTAWLATTDLPEETKQKLLAPTP